MSSASATRTAAKARRPRTSGISDPPVRPAAAAGNGAVRDPGLPRLVSGGTPAGAARVRRAGWEHGSRPDDHAGPDDAAPAARAARAEARAPWARGRDGSAARLRRTVLSGKRAAGGA